MFDNAEVGAGRKTAPQAGLRALSKTQRIAALREMIAEVPGRADNAIPTTVPRHEVLAVPGELAELLPDGGLVPGTMVGCPRGGVLCALLAAASSTGKDTVLVTGKQPMQLGALAMWEMGADLRRLYFVAADSDMAVAAVSTLVDGVSMVAVDMPQVQVPPRQLDQLLSRVRSARSVLVVTGGQWAREQPQLIIDVRPIAVVGLGPGSGRIREVEYELEIRVRDRVVRRGRMSTISAGGGHTRWVGSHSAATAAMKLAHTG